MAALVTKQSACLKVLFILHLNSSNTGLPRHHRSKNITNLKHC